MQNYEYWHASSSQAHRDSLNARMPEADKLRLFCLSFQREDIFSNMSLDTSLDSC